MPDDDDDDDDDDDSIGQCEKAVHTNMCLILNVFMFC